MKRRVVQILPCAGLAGAATLTSFTVPASAEKRTITVKLLNGRIVTLTIDVPPGTPLSQIRVPGVVENTPAPGAPAPQPVVPGQVAPKPGAGTQQAPGGGDRTS